MVGVDGKQTYYICGVEARPGHGEESKCLAYPQGSTEPLWEYPLEEAEDDVIGAALVEGRLYVTTGDGLLFAIGDGQSPDQANLGELQPTVMSAETQTTEVVEAAGNLLDSQIAWQYQIPEPLKEQFWHYFHVTEDGWI
jgi:hypothetical protein